MNYRRSTRPGRTRPGSTTTSLGGKDNFAADREMAEKAQASWGTIRTSGSAREPGVPRGPCGPGTSPGRPASASSSTSAPGCRPPATSTRSPRAPPRPARVVYVDNDPLVLTHARALLTSGPRGPHRLYPRRPARPGRASSATRGCASMLDLIPAGRADARSGSCTSSRTRTTPGDIVARLLRRPAVRAAIWPCSIRPATSTPRVSAPTAPTAARASRSSTAPRTSSRGSSPGSRSFRREFSSCRSGGPKMNRSRAHPPRTPRRTGPSPARPDGLRPGRRRPGRTAARRRAAPARTAARPDGGPARRSWPGRREPYS